MDDGSALNLNFERRCEEAKNSNELKSDRFIKVICMKVLTLLIHGVLARKFHVGCELRHFSDKFFLKFGAF